MGALYGKYSITGLPSWVNSAELIVMALSATHASKIAAAHLGLEFEFLDSRPDVVVKYLESADHVAGPCRVLRDIPQES